jgi:methionine aminopeptidase
MIVSEIKQGVTTSCIDKLAEAFISDHAEPGFLDMYGFPKPLWQIIPQPSSLLNMTIAKR